MNTRNLDELMGILDQQFSNEVDGWGTIVPLATENIKYLREKLAKFQKFFKEIDYREPDSVGYVMRDLKLDYKDFE